MNTRRNLAGRRQATPHGRPALPGVAPVRPAPLRVELAAFRRRFPDMSSQSSWTAQRLLRGAYAAGCMLFVTCAVISGLVLQPVALSRRVMLPGDTACGDGGQLPSSVSTALREVTGYSDLTCACGHVSLHAQDAPSSPNKTRIILPEAPTGGKRLLYGWLSSTSQLVAQSTPVTLVADLPSGSAAVLDTVTGPGMAASCSFTQWPLLLAFLPAGAQDTIDAYALGTDGGVAAGVWACSTGQATASAPDPSAAWLWDALDAPDCVAERTSHSVLLDALALGASLVATFLSAMRREHKAGRRAAAARQERAAATAGGADSYSAVPTALASRPALIVALVLLAVNTVNGGLALGKLANQPLRCAGPGAAAQWNEWVAAIASSSLIVSVVGIGMGIAALSAHFSDMEALSKHTATVAGVLGGLLLLVLLPHLLSGAVVFIGVWMFNAIALLLVLLVAAGCLAVLALGVWKLWRLCRPPEDTAPEQGGLTTTAALQRVLLAMSALSVGVWVAALPQLAAVRLRFGMEDTLCRGVEGAIEDTYKEAFPWDFATLAFPNPTPAILSLNVGFAAVISFLSQNAAGCVAVGVAVGTLCACAAARRYSQAQPTPPATEMSAPSKPSQPATA